MLILANLLFSLSQSHIQRLQLSLSLKNWTSQIIHRSRLAWFPPLPAWLLVLLSGQSGVHKFQEYFSDVKAPAYVADIACITDQRISCVCHLLTGEVHGQALTGLHPLRILLHHGFSGGTRDATLFVWVALSGKNREPCYFTILPYPSYEIRSSESCKNESYVISSDLLNRMLYLLLSIVLSFSWIAESNWKLLCWQINFFSLHILVLIVLLSSNEFSKKERLKISLIEMWLESCVSHIWWHLFAQTRPGFTHNSAEPGKGILRLENTVSERADGSIARWKIESWNN